MREIKQTISCFLKLDRIAVADTTTDTFRCHDMFVHYAYIISYLCCFRLCSSYFTLRTYYYFVNEYRSIIITMIGCAYNEKSPNYKYCIE